jgi:GT2 family glycosyltransferase
MKIAVLILTWNAADAAVACLNSLLLQQRPPDYIMVVDNASKDDTVSRIQSVHPPVRLVQNARNLGFATGMNTGIAALRQLSIPPDLVVLLNQDTVLDQGWLGALEAACADDPQIGAVGCKILSFEGVIDHAGAYLDWPRALSHHIGWREPDMGQYDEPRDCEAVTGAAMALRMSALDKVGVLDECYTPAYYEDFDLCWRLRQHGYRIRYAPDAVLRHYVSLSTATDTTTRSSYAHRGRLRFILKSYAYSDILHDFAASELAAIRAFGRTQEARAWRWALLETSLHLDEIVQARRAYHPALTLQERDNLYRLLVELKQALTQSLYQEAHQMIRAAAVSTAQAE